MKGFQVAALLGWSLSPIVAFQTRVSLSSSRKPSPRLFAIDPTHFIQHDVSLWTDSSALTYLADAAAGVVDPNTATGALQDAGTAVENVMQAAASTEIEIAKDEGWWQAYLNIFKETLNLIHNTIDEPLRNNGVTQTWGISIALFTASFRTLLLPLSLQQTKSSEYMKALKPYQDEIKKKFKDNKDAQNRATAKLFEDADQNPLAGCFISLAQLPVLLGLYRGIRLLAIDGKLDEPFLWIPSLEGPVTAETDFRGLDWLTQGWVGTNPPLGWETTLAFLVMPVLLVLGQSLTMSVLQPPVSEDMTEEEREQMEKTQGILKFLPLMIGFFSLQVPAGLTIYWFTTNLFTLASTLLGKAYYKANPPQIELPEYWDAMDNLDEMSSEEKRKAAQAGLQVGPTFESMLEEAKFHNVVERKPLRLAVATGDIPEELEAWVGPRINGETTLSAEKAEATI